jgi:hypothetical protein
VRPSFCSCMLARWLCVFVVFFLTAVAVPVLHTVQIEIVCRTFYCTILVPPDESRIAASSRSSVARLTRHGLLTWRRLATEDAAPAAPVRVGASACRRIRCVFARSRGPFRFRGLDRSTLLCSADMHGPRPDRDRSVLRGCCAAVPGAGSLCYEDTKGERERGQAGQQGATAMAYVQTEQRGYNASDVGSGSGLGRIALGLRSQQHCYFAQTAAGISFVFSPFIQH